MVTSMTTKTTRPMSASIRQILLVPCMASIVFNASISIAGSSPVDELRQKIETLEDQAFSKEKMARNVEEHGLVPAWDRLNAATPTGRFDVFTNLGIESVTLGRETARASYKHDIEEVKYAGGGLQLDASAWNNLVQSLKDQGFEITHSDWHQERFETNQSGNAVTDTRFNLEGRRNGGLDRMEIKATTRITWKKSGDSFIPAHVEVLDGKIRRRAGNPAFVQSMRLNLGSVDAPQLFSETGGEGSFCVYDLNGDQLPEIIIPSRNTVLWNRGHFKFESSKLYAGAGATPSSQIGLLADLNGDGIPDWVCDIGEGLEYHVGLKNPTLEAAFSSEAVKISLTNCPLKMVSCITAADFNHDGHVDLFVAQYRHPYESMPKKFWDANDGYGNTLLINDGKGHFADQTEASGLAVKRFRRTYAASFVDVNADGNLDLVVVSDFYGTDLYLGDGHGKFTDATAKLLDAPHTFGMSLTVADFDRDGRLDMFVPGMSSTTSRRLERMGAFPEGFEEANRMRTIMGYGNRMYLAKPEGGFAEPSFKDAVARTGWSWGSTAFDFDNDGFEDIFVANGHVTGKSTSDYCTSFWSHDIYVLPGESQPVVQSYLNSDPKRENMSWDGYQVKSLLVNQSGKGFQDFSYMLDTGFDYDSRQAVSADLDQDGRVDLIITRMPEIGPKGTAEDSRPTSIVIYQNTLTEAAQRDWIGVSLTGTPNVSPLGAVVELNTDKGIRRATVISGDSYRCQHPAQKHFGIESGNTVQSITVKWPDGSQTVLPKPALRQYHLIAPPATTSKL
jgi:enediyne biosynthesis protein E4